MGKEIETGWNTYHSSPKDIAANQEFCKSKNIAELIRLRDACLEAVKEYEAREDFHDWKIEKKPDGDYPIFLYEDGILLNLQGVTNRDLLVEIYHCFIKRVPAKG